MRAPDRRRIRSSEMFQALGYQLRACRDDAGLEAMILSDEDGLTLAAAGAADTCDEVAATVPMLGRKAGDFNGVLLAGRGQVAAQVQRFRIDATELYMCAVGGTDELRARQIARGIRGCARILASA
jgi:hypothetical protein